MTIARRVVSSLPGDEDALLISLGDRAGLEVATELHTELESAAARGARRVIVEPARDAPVDPTLLAGLRRLQRADAELVLVAEDGLNTETAVDALRLDRFFRIERTLPEAVAAFESQGRFGLRTFRPRSRVFVEP